jgi:hypothetical protein
MIDAGFLNVVGGVTPAPDDSAWEAIFEESLSQGGAGGFPVMDYGDDIQHIDDPLAARMVADAEYYVEQTGDYAGMHMRLPELLASQSGDIPPRYARWNESTLSYDLFDPTNPGVYMRWNSTGSSYDVVPANLPFDDPTHFSDTVGLAIRRDPVTGEPVLGYDPVIDPATGLPVIDPATGLPVPDLSTGQIIVDNPNAIVELPPGYYPNGMRLTRGDDVTLKPQLGTNGTQADKFFIWGGGQGGTDVGLYMNAGSLTGHGVTCYVTQNFDTGVPGVLRITGGSVELDSPGDWQNDQNGTFNLSLVEGLNGIAIWQDPTMPNLPDAHLNGNGDFSISGTIYCPDPIHMRLEGDLGDTGNQVLCGTANIMGTASININYDGRNFGDTTARSCLVW